MTVSRSTLLIQRPLMSLVSAVGSYLLRNNCPPDYVYSSRCLQLSPLARAMLSKSTPCAFVTYHISQRSSRFAQAVINRMMHHSVPILFSQVVAAFDGAKNMYSLQRPLFEQGQMTVCFLSGSPSTQYPNRSLVQRKYERRSPGRS